MERDQESAAADGEAAHEPLRVRTGAGARIFQLALDPPSQSSEGPARPSPGAAFAGFTIVGELGRGGMGVVYRARDGFGRDVALKLGTLGGAPNAQRLERLRREGQITAALEHPHIVRIHAAGVADGVPYLAYELIEDCRSLDEALLGVERPRALTMLRDLAGALGHAHRHGVVHRDVKPENVLIDASGRVRLADFGLGLVRDLDRLTATGTLLGTPLYMAPEQILGQRDRVGPWSDTWSLGVMLYELLTGTLPFQGASLAHLMVALSEGRVTPPRELDGSVSRAEEAVVLKALARTPEERYPDADQLAEDLDSLLAGKRPRRALPGRAWSPRTLGALATALAGACALAFLGVGLPPPPGEERQSTPPTGATSPPASPAATPSPEPAPQPFAPPAPVFPAAYPEETELLRLAREAAEGGDPDATWQVGELLRDGQGVRQDPAAALPWFRRAARLGGQELERRLGKALQEGDRLPPDLREAEYWLRAAAARGDAMAKVYLCDLVEREEALRLAREAADAGEVFGMTRLGRLLLAGSPAEQSAAHAWLQRAGAGGDAWAFLPLGTALLSGRGVDPNPPAALAYLERASAGDVDPASLLLGELLRGRRGVPADPARARRIFADLAARGHLRAMRLLAEMLRRGEGGEVDPVEADAWLRRAQAGETPAGAR